MVSSSPACEAERRRPGDCGPAVGHGDSREIEDLWIPISRLEHHAYCQRQAVLIDREAWADDTATAHGSVVHARVDSGVSDRRNGLRVHHAVPLRHDGLLIYGVADTIEELPDGTLTPVEHKSGRSVRAPIPAILQVAAQALCLESMTGRVVPTAALYFAKDNKRLSVDVESQRLPVERCVADLRRNLQSDGLPPWTEQGQRCRACSLRATCMPELYVAGTA